MYLYFIAPTPPALWPGTPDPRNMDVRRYDIIDILPVFCKSNSFVVFSIFPEFFSQSTNLVSFPFHEFFFMPKISHSLSFENPAQNANFWLVHLFAQNSAQQQKLSLVQLISFQRLDLWILILKKATLASSWKKFLGLKIVSEYTSRT